MGALSIIKFECMKNYINFRHVDKKRLRTLKNIHQGKRCFIIGNGPSLLASDLECLKDEICFAANRIYELYDKTEWRPTYYAISDGGIVKNIASKACKCVEASLCFFPAIDGYNIALSPNTILFRMVENKDISHMKFTSDISKGIYEGCTVTYVLTQLAVYMGFIEIYYLGMDCSNFGYHFYEDSKEKGLGVSENAIRVSMRSFERTAQYCVSKNIKVINATRGGKLETFPRICFDELVKGKDLHG